MDGNTSDQDEKEKFENFGEEATEFKQVIESNEENVTSIKDNVIDLMDSRKLTLFPD